MSRDMSFEMNFVSKLKDAVHSDNRGALADMRRLFVDDVVRCLKGMYRAGLPISHKYADDREAYRITAALFSYYPDGDCSKEHFDFGCTMKYIRNLDPENKSMEKRFTALLKSSDSKEILVHLRSLIGIAKQKGAKINYALLLYHLKQWNNPSGWVQVKMAENFWS